MPLLCVNDTSLLCFCLSVFTVGWECCLFFALSLQASKSLLLGCGGDGGGDVLELVA